MRAAFVAVVVVALPLTACLDLSPKVPEGFPDLKLGEGAHATWKHEDASRDVRADVGVLNSDGKPGVLVGLDHPSVLLRFEEVKKGTFETPESIGDAVIIEKDADDELWSDGQVGGHGSVTIESFEDGVVAGSFEGTVCAFNETTSELTCQEITDGKFSATDDRDRQ